MNKYKNQKHVVIEVSIKIIKIINIIIIHFITVFVSK